MRNTTLKDVAMLAGVTASTVSYVLNDNKKQSISEETRGRVMDAAAKLNYVPNNAARILKNNRSGNIGVVLGKTLALERFARTVQGIRSRLFQDGYNVLLCSPYRGNGVYADYLESYLKNFLDGLVFIGRDNVGPTAEEIDILKKFRIPLVIFDCFSDEGLSAIDFDYQGGSYSLVKELLEERFDKVTYIRPEAENAQEQLREAGVRAAIMEYEGISFEVARFPIDNADLVMFDGDVENYQTSISNSIDCSLKDILRRKLHEDHSTELVISSWGPIMDRIEEIYNTAGRKVKFASLAEPATYGNAKGRVSYCILDHIGAGAECADLLLDLINGIQDSNVPQRKIIKVNHILR